VLDAVAFRVFLGKYFKSEWVLTLVTQIQIYALQLGYHLLIWCFDFNLFDTKGFSLNWFQTQEKNFKNIYLINQNLKKLLVSGSYISK
jgi:hypothetical protein